MFVVACLRDLWGRLAMDKFTSLQVYSGVGNHFCGSYPLGYLTYHLLKEQKSSRRFG